MALTTEQLFYVHLLFCRKTGRNSGSNFKENVSEIAKLFPMSLRACEVTESSHSQPPRQRRSRDRANHLTSKGRGPY